MDTSETYIKMCEKATEIQSLWKPQNGDFCWHDNEGDDIYGVWEFPAEKSIAILTEVKTPDWWLNWLWLPRQDQLQEIIIGKIDHWTTATTGLSNLAKFAEEIEFDSMEQLWLAFVMKDKYDKIWNGEDWVVKI